MDLPSRRSLKIGILALIGLLLAFDVCLLNSPARMLVYYVFGRHGCCGFRASLPAGKYLERRAAAISHVRKNSREISDDGKFALWRTPDGPFWVPARDKTGFVGLLAEQELRVYGPIKKGSVVLDCGANIGDFTRSALLDGAARVVAMEIAPDTLECLRRNVKDEIASGRVIIVPEGVWDRDDTLKIFTSKVMGSGVDTVVNRDANSNEGPEVKMTTIDKIVQRLNLSSVDMIKLDVEGAEFRALVGARQTIRKYRPRIAFDSEDFSIQDITNIQHELDTAAPGYRIAVGPCIELRIGIRADIIRFEPSTK